MRRGLRNDPVLLPCVLVKYLNFYPIGMEEPDPPPAFQRGHDTQTPPLGALAMSTDQPVHQLGLPTGPPGAGRLRDVGPHPAADDEQGVDACD